MRSVNDSRLLHVTMCFLPQQSALYDPLASEFSRLLSVGNKNVGIPRNANVVEDLNGVRSVVLVVIGPVLLALIRSVVVAGFFQLDVTQREGTFGFVGSIDASVCSPRKIDHIFCIANRDTLSPGWLA